MSTYKVEICGVNTAQLPILKEEEKDELFKKIKAGDKASRETYIKGNLRLVLSVIKRFNNHNENVDDLFQIGCIGLMKAIDNFDTSVGVKFSTYAVPMIIGEIRRYLRDNSSYRIPRSLRDIAYKAMQAKERLAKNAQKEPTLEEIAAECEIPVEDVVYALDAIQTVSSFWKEVRSEMLDISGWWYVWLPISGLYGWRGHPVCDGSDFGQEKQRRALGGGFVTFRCPVTSE